MIWSDQQRALGEEMIVEENGKVMCMGYARFRKDSDGAFATWCQRVRDEVDTPAAEPRLRELQHLLCELVDQLDPGRLRYSPQDLQRA